MSKLLTIIVPTYNRSGCLEVLLSALALELRGCEDAVNVIIGDNASIDNTSAVIEAFVEKWSSTKVLWHKENLGADENFCRCVECVETPYFWIMGDDDLPSFGSIKLLLDLLNGYHPDLVYLVSQWSPELNLNAQDSVAELEASMIDKRSFGRRVNVWMTFISGLIVKRDLTAVESLRQFTGTNLVQLGWVFSALRKGRRFLYVHTPCVQARSGNTGGYSLLRVFGRNFQQVTRQALSDDADQHALAEEIIRRTTISFLPGLVWGYRQGSLGVFNPDESFESLDYELRRSFPFRLLIEPLERATPRQAKAIIFFARCLTRLIRSYDLGYAWLFGECQRVRSRCK